MKNRRCQLNSNIANKKTMIIVCNCGLIVLGMREICIAKLKRSQRPCRCRILVSPNRLRSCGLVGLKRRTRLDRIVDSVGGGSLDARGHSDLGPDTKNDREIARNGVRIDKRTNEVTRLGFEPRMTEPKSVVLPLHHRAIWEEFTTFDVHSQR